MREIATISEVRDGVIAALGERFPDFAVYEGELPEVPVVPFFHVRPFPVTQTREVGRRYRRTFSFDILLKASTQDELLEAADGLLDELVYIEVDGFPCRGNGLKHEIVDGELHVYVQYTLHLLRERQEVTRMDKLAQEGRIKDA
ncbi:DUF6838 family protein [Paenibacillus sp. 1P07SE]|uniref:phage tail terminator family protein n=1 Tax=Paenibacillus sp. 1P07SE TaxID=3132209 RepID=UPI0039A4DE8A